MKKTIKNTIIISGIIICILLISLGITNLVGKSEDSNNKLNEIKSNDERFITIQNRLQNNNELRQINIKNTELDNDTILRYIFNNLTEENMSTKKIKSKKGICKVTKSIAFQSNKSCNIKIIKNELIVSKQKEYFNLESEITYNDIDHNGLYCINDSKNYYCIESTNKKTINNYSLVDKVYEDSNQLIVYEYYLSINLENEKNCLEYYNNDYCANYLNEEKPTISESTIKENGVQYKHIFTKNENNYYLEQSSVIIE